uniref:Uncharacterized protein n=1 Tax=Tanacetum cinerariifolium TaxID=118510 RepID=A0A6L2KZ54_TANCI|nr:hypothetical protein [Tanacetum cinerariifolium]
MTLILDIPNPTPLNTFVLKHLLKPKEQQKSIQEFTDQLFKTTSLKFSPTSPKEPTPPRDSSKGKSVTIIEEPRNELVKYQVEGGSDPKVTKLKSFITPKGPLSQEEYNNQIKEMKRLNDLKAEQENSKHELRKLFNPATLKAQAQKWIEHEAKKGKMMQEYKHQISFKVDTLIFQSTIPGGLTAKGIASIATSSSSGMIFINCLSSLISFSSSTFCFLALSYVSSSPALFELPLTNSVLKSTNMFMLFKALSNIF